MTKNTTILAIGLAPAMMLAACGSEEAEPVAQPTGNSAEGEIAGGSISDSMPQLEQLQSVAPSAASDEGAGDNEGDVEGEDSVSDD